MTDNRQGWYAVHVGVGREEAMASRISRVLQGYGLEEAFFPKFEVEQKFHGEWKRVLKPLWPGYIIAGTDPLRRWPKVAASSPSTLASSR